MEDLVKLAERQNGMICTCLTSRSYYSSGGRTTTVRDRQSGRASRFDRFWLWLSHLLKG